MAAIGTLVIKHGHMYAWSSTVEGCLLNLVLCLQYICIITQVTQLNFNDLTLSKACFEPGATMYPQIRKFSAHTKTHYFYNHKKTKRPFSSTFCYIIITLKFKHVFWHLKSNYNIRNIIIKQNINGTLEKW